MKSLMDSLRVVMRLSCSSWGRCPHTPGKSHELRRLSSVRFWRFPLPSVERTEGPPRGTERNKEEHDGYSSSSFIRSHFIHSFEQTALCLEWVLGEKSILYMYQYATRADRYRRYDSTKTDETCSRRHGGDAPIPPGKLFSSPFCTDAQRGMTPVPFWTRRHRSPFLMGALPPYPR